MRPPKIFSDLNPEPAAHDDSEGSRQFELHLPAGTADKFQSAVASIPADKRVWWRYHKVQDGETLAPSRAPITRLRRRLPKPTTWETRPLDPESRLIIPIAPGKQTDTSTYARAITRYKIRKGDTVESVAENFGVSPKMLRGWNHIKGSSLAGRKVLYLHLPVTRAAGNTQVASKHPSKSKHHASSSSASSSATQTAATKSSSSGVVHHNVKAGELSTQSPAPITRPSLPSSTTTATSLRCVPE